MNRNKVQNSIISIWIVIPIILLITTPNWTSLISRESKNKKISQCIYSSILNPYIGIGTIFINQEQRNY
ncbi:hypothetical protein HZS_738 [Henneguya salminicola]|nr:hypothetical protein HZS_738 [Henneguya salminicola]